MGRFFPYEKALVEAVEGGVYVFTGGRVTWGCHDVTASLLRPSLVSSRDVYTVFWFLY